MIWESRTVKSMDVRLANKSIVQSLTLEMEIIYFIDFDTMRLHKMWLG